MQNAITDFMSFDHDRLDKLFRKFQKLKNKNPREAKLLFFEFKNDLERHILWEEEILFPVFEEKTQTPEGGPTEVMRQEHRKIKQSLAQIDEAIRNNAGKTNQWEEELLEVLSLHNGKEEFVLYPGIDRLLTEEESKKILARLIKLNEESEKCCAGCTCGN